MNELSGLAICILFYEKLEQTIECINSFLQSDVNIYVLNNGSSSLSRELLGKFCEKYRQIKIFNSDVNLGVGVGRNYLTTHTTEEWLLFVDNDIVIKTSDWLERFSKHASINNGTQVFVPLLYNARAKTYTVYYSLRIEGKKAVADRIIIDDSINTFPGGASFINRKLFNRLGFYDEKIFVALEDFELSIRGIISGEPVKSRLIYDIELVHDHRLPKEKKDRVAAMARYNVNSVEVSHNRIAEKFGIFLIDTWKESTIDNLKYMVNSSNPLSTYFWKRLIPKPIKRGLRNIEARIRGRVVPTFGNLYMTDRCNFKCPSCRRNVVGIGTSKEMTLVTVQRLLSLYPSINRFCIAGLGEPTLCQNFVEIVDFLKRIQKSVGIITNGTNPSKLLELTYEPDYISISLYGYNDEQYIPYAGSGVFERVIENFKNIKSRFKNVGFSYIVNKTNYGTVDKILELCDKLKPNFLDLHNYLAYDPDNREEISKIITVKDKEIISYIDAICNRRGYRVNKPVLVDFDKPKFWCRSYNYLINLDGSGNIGGCQRHIPPDQSFGNIFNDEDPFNSTEMKRLRKIMHKKTYMHKECSFCYGNWYKC